MQLKDYASALKCLQKAQTISPMNIQKLCAIAEVNSELGNEEASESALNKAKSLDNPSEYIPEAEVSIALSKGDTEKAKKIMENVTAIQNLIAYLNNRAVAHARCNQLEEGLKLYEKTIDSIPESKIQLIALVQYNIALAHIRNQDAEKAKSYLLEAIKAGDSKVLNKAKSLYNRIQKNLRINLDSSDARVEASDEGQEAKSSSPAVSHGSIIATIVTIPGQQRCYQIYRHHKQPAAVLKEMWSNLPHFTPRSAIARDISSGLEKMIKSGG